jgi:hypothetical protein
MGHDGQRPDSHLAFALGRHYHHHHLPTYSCYSHLTTSSDPSIHPSSQSGEQVVVQLLLPLILLLSSPLLSSASPPPSLRPPSPPSIDKLWCGLFSRRLKIPPGQDNGLASAPNLFTFSPYPSLSPPYRTCTRLLTYNTYITLRAAFRHHYFQRQSCCASST